MAQQQNQNNQTQKSSQKSGQQGQPWKKEDEMKKNKNKETLEFDSDSDVSDDEDSEDAIRTSGKNATKRTDQPRGDTQQNHNISGSATKATSGMGHAKSRDPSSQR